MSLIFIHHPHWPKEISYFPPNKTALRNKWQLRVQWYFFKELNLIDLRRSSLKCTSWREKRFLCATAAVPGSTLAVSHVNPVTWATWSLLLWPCDSKTPEAVSLSYLNTQPCNIYPHEPTSIRAGSTASALRLTTVLMASCSSVSRIKQVIDFISS